MKDLLIKKSFSTINEFFVMEPIKRLLVNISQGFGKTQVDKFPEKVKLIRMKIEELAAAGVLFFCAAGDDNSLADQDLEFPANLPSVISVGCISAENLGMNISKSITFASKFQECRSFDSSFNVIPDTGSSFSAPVMASIAAQIKPAGTISKTDFINAVSAFDMATNAFDFRTDKYQFSLIK